MLKVIKKILNWRAVNYLIAVAIFILAFNIITTIYTNKTNPVEPIIYLQSSDELIADVKEEEYIISEEMIMSKLEIKSQIVSLEQNLHKTDIRVDKKLFGKRQTQLEVNGTYKMGLNTGDIKVKHIDSASGIVYMELPNPILISLELPYDQVDFDKTKGFFRKKMKESEKKSFYKSTKDNIRYELTNDENLLKQADLFNQKAIQDILTTMTEIKSIVFIDREE